VGDEAHVLHVGLGHTADLLVIAPCTANTIAKLAHGQADTLLTVTALATQALLIIAPAMDGGMFDHPATQENLDTLRKRGAYIIEPAEGHLASGLSGKGRLPERLNSSDTSASFSDAAVCSPVKKSSITAGGTQEPLDPVRVLTNRSSGKQGYALAQAALDAGAQVTLITAPVCINSARRRGGCSSGNGEADAGCRVERIPRKRRAHHGGGGGGFQAEEQAEGQDQEGGRDSADRTRSHGGYPENGGRFEGVEKKRPQRRGRGSRQSRRVFLQNAANKLQSKKLDLIAANDISAGDAGFSVETNRITLLFADGRRESLSLMSKIEAAEIIVERVAALLE
jgi:phosphopantothenoylcysteine decarboxylase / phosphopantothenate---cysteine ligase